MKKVPEQGSYEQGEDTPLHVRVRETRLDSLPTIGGQLVVPGTAVHVLAGGELSASSGAGEWSVPQEETVSNHHGDARPSLVLCGTFEHMIKAWSSLPANKGEPAGFHSERRLRRTEHSALSGMLHP